MLKTIIYIVVTLFLFTILFSTIYLLNSTLTIILFIAAIISLFSPIFFKKLFGFTSMYKIPNLVKKLAEEMNWSYGKIINYGETEASILGKNEYLTNIRGEWGNPLFNERKVEGSIGVFKNHEIAIARLLEPVSAGEFPSVVYSTFISIKLKNKFNKRIEVYPTISLKSSDFKKTNLNIIKFDERFNCLFSLFSDDIKKAKNIFNSEIREKILDIKEDFIILIHDNMINFSFGGAGSSEKLPDKNDLIKVLNLLINIANKIER